MQLATQIVASLMALETLSPNEDIKMYINSSGASYFMLMLTLVQSNMMLITPFFLSQITVQSGVVT